jgi:Zn/Cd-binding protein ZinT
MRSSWRGVYPGLGLDNMDQTLQMKDDRLGKMTWQPDQKLFNQVFRLSVGEIMADISKLDLISDFQGFCHPINRPFAEVDAHVFGRYTRFSKC